MASGFHPRTALDTGAIPAHLRLPEGDAVLSGMACWLLGSGFTSTPGGTLPEQQLQADTMTYPAEQAIDASWLTAQPYQAAGSNMQPNIACLQHAASAVGQGRLQPAEGFASSRPYAAMHKGAYQPLSETQTTQQMADVDAPGRQPLAHPLEQGHSASLAHFKHLVEVCKAPVPQQQSGGGPSHMALQSPTPLFMLPSMHQGTTPGSQLPPTGESGASPGGLGATSWLDSTPVQPQMDAPPRLITSHTPGSFTHVLYHSESALAGESPDSAESARMAWDLSSSQAVGAQGQNQAAAAEFVASGLRPLQSQVLDASTASHAGHQHVASGDIIPEDQPRLFASWSAGRRPDSAPNAALLPSSAGHKRKAAEGEVLEGHFDEFDSIDLEGILGDAATAASWEARGGSSDGAAQAGEQHMQLGDMAQVQVAAQQVLPAAPAAAAAAAPAAPAAPAAETKRPKKKRKTGHKSSSHRAVPAAPVPHAAHGPAHGPVMHAAHPVAQDRPATGPSRSRARPRYQPYARPNPQPQPRRKAQPRSQAQPQVAAPPSKPAATHAATAAATPAGTPAAAPAATPAAAPAQGPEYQTGQVVWAKSRTWPWWPAIVADPSAAQRRATKMGTNTNKVFVTYFGTDEYEALPIKKIRQWGAHKASVNGMPELLDAVQLAKQAMSVCAQ